MNNYSKLKRFYQRYDLPLLAVHQIVRSPEFYSVFSEFTTRSLFLQSCCFIYPRSPPRFSHLLFLSFPFSGARAKRSGRVAKQDRAITCTKVLPNTSNKMHIIARVRSNARNNIVQPRRYDPADIFIFGVSGGCGAA